MHFREYSKLDLPQLAKSIRDFWQQNEIFSQTLAIREGAPRFIFFEGPPSANGRPGIHHVMARAIKDAVCRYRTQKGFLVERKAGWDTHGLPVELGVEAKLGISKVDIGQKVSVEEYNQTCREEVMRYTDDWRELTEMMGYWVDMDHPYVTYENKYIETLWFLLSQLYERGLLYKGKTIQPYSPAAGTGLSTHELNQPGCYRDVSDTTVVGQFQALTPEREPIEIEGKKLYFLAWTTTPWTLPSNTALAVGEKIQYNFIETFNTYTGDPCVVILAVPRTDYYFKRDLKDAPMEYTPEGKGNVPWRILKTVDGASLKGMRYLPLFDWLRIDDSTHQVITADFVTTEDGTGIVHIAPTFGADDARVAQQQGISGAVLLTAESEQAPMVDKRGRFYPIEALDDEYVAQHLNIEQYKGWAGRYVKPVYTEPEDPMGGELDIDLCVDLKHRGLAFRVEKHTHSYPHCWRTDKPVLYYPLDSWFIATSKFKERMIELNSTIDWHPESTGTGRFGKWLENLVDWNLSRSRFWGTPLPIWVSEDRAESICIGSLAQLKEECQRAVAAGLMKDDPMADFKPEDMSDENYAQVDLHRPFVDEIILLSPSGKPMRREPDLIDVWFDSGAMPYAQWHYPFENQDVCQRSIPADFIAEGVDQTRGWFFTLHAISTMIDDQVAFKSIISNGLVLDKRGNKMSKRLNNTVDPFELMSRLGPDPLRWYMLTNSQPWDNLKFDVSGVEEVVRKFFGTLYNTYSFFALYANVDEFDPTAPAVPFQSRPELDRWILSRLHQLIQHVDTCFENYDLTAAGRAIQEFVIEHLSNWYVRLNRKRFWGGAMTEDKLSAYQTLYECLETVARLMAPIAPFYADQLFQDLYMGTDCSDKPQSVHLVYFPEANTEIIDERLMARMALAQSFTSLILALRRKVAIKVRQPLSRIMIPVLNEQFAQDLREVERILLNEVNIKEVEYLAPDNTVLTKRVKPDFKKLGPKLGPRMKKVAALLTSLSQQEISQFEREELLTIEMDGEPIEVHLSDVEIVPEDIPGCLVATDDGLTVALDVTLTDELLAEGAARELINRIQNLRKDVGLNVTDRILLTIACEDKAWNALEPHLEFVAAQTLADKVLRTDSLTGEDSSVEVELDKSLGIATLEIARV